jgi:hypothetical protein
MLTYPNQADLNGWEISLPSFPIVDASLPIAENKNLAFMRFRPSMVA